MKSKFDAWEQGVQNRGLNELEEALIAARGGGLRLLGVSYGSQQLVFEFNRELRSIDEAWRHLFGVGATATSDPSAARWYEDHPEMGLVAKNTRRDGKRLIISDGLRFAYAQLREEIKLRHGFIRDLDAELGSQVLTAPQQAFNTCFNKRFERAAFVECLMHRARHKWQTIKSSGQIIAGIDRKQGAPQHAVTPLDRTRVLAVLEGWSENATYMDLKLFDKCQMSFQPKLAPYVTTPFTTADCRHYRIGVDDVETASKLITMPGVHEGSFNCLPTPGAIMSVGDVFEKTTRRYIESRSYYRIYGEQLGAEVPNINDYFTTLLEWDTHHCYGLLLQLNKFNTWVSQGDGELPEIAAAAWSWVLKSAISGSAIYKRYNLIHDSEDLLDSIHDLDYQNYP
ncbi:MAG: hypothetical protein L3J28_06335 [Candidatus Polarisedimenticolaceae bacterium]|nr:hypothetical protein [Candidatus Polarisedimenticolaceae bacterium]